MGQLLKRSHHKGARYGEAVLEYFPASAKF